MPRPAKAYCSQPRPSGKGRRLPRARLGIGLWGSEIMPSGSRLEASAKKSEIHSVGADEV